MAIKINNLGNKNKYNVTYSDIHFDLKSIQVDGGKKTSNNIAIGKDILKDVDSTAIRNSLVNLLTTTPGERPLTPGFGVNLLRYVGSQLTTVVGESIGSEIKKAIHLWEPRVSVMGVVVNVQPDQSAFQILILMTPLFLQEKQFILGGSLSQENGMKFIPF